ncbi:MAG: NADH-quinone oxidoreductase subunit G [Betaproteobacteria bacterium]|nr:NADH-quinone oxidoreductase subunit G [Betaproteobacteria bacterium]MBI3938760.1 NADH-quinone oxidoreductase subunit G [Betaproteobacteria bacterium]
MIEIEIDGRQLQVAEGSTIMDAAHRAGIFVPHFCYHEKLSIAANCRMCLVEVEKAPKPLPACATPVMNGMRVFTHSEQAIDAQKGVMEFLLINHPLDCPICDQGGECQLQDLAVGYGASGSRYEESKRVVSNKNLGSLISTDMTRCIHCTRCVRFGREIAGIMELGMIGRGEHSEIITFIGKTVDSELSGNVIDLCPVGALTSKPFRYSARTWELTRRPSVSPHCGLGANLTVQVKQNRVMRALPRENENINECWLSDKDRFSYEGLNSEQRLARPMLRRGSAWEHVEWQVALDFVARELKRIRERHGAASIGALATPHQTLEELFLLGKLAREFASGNVDFRLRQADFRADERLRGAPWLGMNIAELGSLDRALVVGSTLRKDHPLLAHRLRQAVKRGMQLTLVNPVDDDLLMRVAAKAIVAPQAMPRMLAQVLKAAARLKNGELPAGQRAALEAIEVTEPAERVAASLVSGKSAAVFLGNLAQHHPDALELHALAQELAALTGARAGFLGEAANSVGGYIAGAVPFAAEPRGMNARQMLAEPRKAYLLLGVEAELDTHDPAQALAAMRAAELVVALSPFEHKAVEYAHVMLPVAPFTETAGTFVNTEGAAQSFNGVVRPLAEARPAWKVLRVLGNLLGIPGFGYDSAEQVRDEILGGGELAARLDNRLSDTTLGMIGAAAGGLQRIGEVPIYAADALVRRAQSLQRTRDAATAVAWMNRALFDRLGLRDGDQVRVRQGTGEALVPAAVDDRLPADCVRLAAAREETAALGAMFGPVEAERVAARQQVAV